MKQAFYWLVLYYLRFLAKLQLFKVKPLIIGITGSAGKTSLRDAIGVILKDKYKVKVSYKANSETGIPLNILGFPGRNYSYRDWLWIIPLALWKGLTNWEKYDVYVVEMGVDSPRPPKNMGYLLTIVKPKIGVFLNALAVHSEAFDGLKGRPVDNIAKEKGKLIEALPKDGWAVLNANDKRVMGFKNKTKARVITFKNIEVKIKNQILEKHYESTFAGAVAVAKVLGIDKETAVESLEKHFKLAAGRMSVIPGIKKTTLLDSSYNASRVPMIAALKTLGRAGKGGKIAVLGDMRELGKAAKLEHELVAVEAVKQTEVMVTVGPLMKKFFVAKALNLGFDENKIYSFDNTYRAAEKLKNEIIKGGETILVKASQNTLFFEIIVKALMKHPQEAKKLLCRQNRFWEKKRQAVKKLIQS